MQSSELVRVLAVMAAIAPGAALAQPSPKAPAVDWKCEADRCAGHVAASSQGILQQCRRFVWATGPVSQYRIGERELTGAQLRACNRFVINTQPPRN